MSQNGRLLRLNYNFVNYLRGRVSSGKMTPTTARMTARAITTRVCFTMRSTAAAPTTHHGLKFAQAAARPRLGRQNQKTAIKTPTRMQPPHQTLLGESRIAITIPQTRQPTAIMATSQRLIWVSWEWVTSYPCKMVRSSTETIIKEIATLENLPI